MPPRRITIFDTTLRDGEQPPGIAPRDAFTRFKRPADERKAVTLYDVFEEVPVQ